MNIKSDEYLLKQISTLGIDISSIARVIKEHKERYIISSSDNDFEAEITGNLRYSAQSREDFPAVGDWVEFIAFEKDSAIIQSIIPRKTLLERKLVSSDAEKQIIAANIDVAFIVQSVDRDFNINRLERYVSLIRAGSIAPIIILNKTDLITEEELNVKLSKTTNRFDDIRVLTTSNINSKGINKLKSFLEIGTTYCFVGSSGVGKSSLVNSLIENETLETKEISLSTNKGKHTTTHRELITLDNGSILIDTPGMREIGLTDDIDGIKETFIDIEELATKCKFKDCTHTQEKACAILEALKLGEINSKSYENFQKLIRETEHFQSSVAEKRKKDKEFGKMIKTVVKERKNNKF